MNQKKDEIGKALLRLSRMGSDISKDSIETISLEIKNLTFLELNQLIEMLKEEDVIQRKDSRDSGGLACYGMGDDYTRDEDKSSPSARLSACLANIIRLIDLLKNQKRSLVSNECWVFMDASVRIGTNGVLIPDNILHEFKRTVNTLSDQENIYLLIELKTEEKFRAKKLEQATVTHPIDLRAGLDGDYTSYMPVNTEVFHIQDCLKNTQILISIVADKLGAVKALEAEPPKKKFTFEIETSFFDDDDDSTISSTHEVVVMAESLEEALEIGLGRETNHNGQSCSPSKPDVAFVRVFDEDGNIYRRGSDRKITKSQY